MGLAHVDFDAFEVTRHIRALPDPQGSITIIGVTDMMGGSEACVAAGMSYAVSSRLSHARILRTLIEARVRRPK